MPKNHDEPAKKGPPVEAEASMSDLRSASEALKAKIAEAKARSDMPLDWTLGDPNWDKNAADGAAGPGAGATAGAAAAGGIPATDAAGPGAPCAARIPHAGVPGALPSVAGSPATGGDAAGTGWVTPPR